MTYILVCANLLLSPRAMEMSGNQASIVSHYSSINNMNNHTVHLQIILQNLIWTGKLGDVS